MKENEVMLGMSERMKFAAIFSGLAFFVFSVYSLLMSDSLFAIFILSFAVGLLAFIAIAFIIILIKVIELYYHQQKYLGTNERRIFSVEEWTKKLGIEGEIEYAAFSNYNLLVQPKITKKKEAEVSE